MLALIDAFTYNRMHNPPPMPAASQQPIDFGGLVAAIRQTDAALAAQASRAVNLALTLRNWFIGCYIAEFEFQVPTAPAMATSSSPNWPKPCVAKGSATVAGASSTAIWPSTEPILK